LFSPLPSHLLALPAAAFRQVERVWDQAGKQDNWHITLEDGSVPATAPGQNVAAGDLGEIHPAALTDGQETVIVSCRAIRANQQYTAKRLAEMRSQQARKRKGSRSVKRLPRRQNRFEAQQKRRARDREHKVSRAIVNWVKERAVGTLAVGDVRDVADGKRLNTQNQQKIGVWSHGRQRQYLTTKAKVARITVVLVDEYGTTKTCPSCRHLHQPKGRNYRCPACGLVAHRDAVGSTSNSTPAPTTSALFP